MRGTLFFASLAGILTVALSAQAPRRAAAPAKPFHIVEATIAEMREAMASGRLTSRQLVSQYLMRLGLYEDRLHAAIVVNPRALDEADRLHRQRVAGKLRGPLHGLPVALKDNIHTTHLATTRGALPLPGYLPPYEATAAENL